MTVRPAARLRRFVRRRYDRLRRFRRRGFFDLLRLLLRHRRYFGLIDRVVGRGEINRQRRVGVADFVGPMEENITADGAGVDGEHDCRRNGPAPQIAPVFVLKPWQR